MFIDSHCHLDRLDLSRHNGSLQQLLQAAAGRGVEEMLCVSIDLGLFEQMYDAIAPFANVS